MARIRTSWLVAALAVGLAVTGCKKNDDKNGPASADKATDKAGGMAASAGASEGGNDDLALLPVDSEAVFGVNFGQLQQSPLWKQYVAPRIVGNSGIDKFKLICGFDPLESLKSIVVGGKNLGEDDPNFVFVLHGYDKSKSMTCFDNDGLAEAEKDGSKVKVDGDVVLITDKSGKKVGFTFVNDNTALAVVGPGAESKESLKKIAAGGGTLKSSKTFVELFGKLKTSDTLWMVINGDSPAMKGAGALGIKPKAVFGSLNITDGLTVDGHVRLGTPDEATQLVALLKTQSSNPQVKNFVDKLDITSDGVDTNVSVAISAQKLQTIVGMFSAFAGHGGGGMGGGEPPAAPTTK
jgi:hypothetical protein